MNFTERRGMVRFEVFRFKCVMREKTQAKNSRKTREKTQAKSL